MKDEELIKKAKAELKEAHDFDPRDPLFGLNRTEMSGPKLSRRATLRLLAAGGALSMAHVLPGLRPTPAFAGGHGGGTLNCAWAGVAEITTLDPAQIGQVLQFQITSNVLSGLMHINNNLVSEGDLAETLTAAQEAIDELGAGQIQHGTNVSKVSAVGAGMRTHTGVAAQMFQILSEADISIGMITTSDIKISVQVQRDVAQDALVAIHKGFGLEKAQAESPSVGHAADGSASAGTAQSDIEKVVVENLASMEDIVVSEVQLDNEQGRITINNLPDEAGVAGKLFGAVAEGGIMVDMIVQNVGRDGRARLTFTVPRSGLDQCLLLVREVLEAWPDTDLSHDREIAKLSVMGIGLRSHTGVGQQMFKALSEAGINVQMINTSEIRISAVVSAEQGEAAHQSLLKAFGL